MKTSFLLKVFGRKACGNTTVSDSNEVCFFRYNPPSNLTLAELTGYSANSKEVIRLRALYGAEKELTKSGRLQHGSRRYLAELSKLHNQYTRKAQINMSKGQPKKSYQEVPHPGCISSFS